MQKLMCLGSACVDDYSQTAVARRYVGGGPLNAAVHAVNEELEVSYISAIGNDEASRHFLTETEKYNIDTSHLHIRNGRTPSCQILLEGNERILDYYDEGVYKDFVIDDDDREFVTSFDVCLSDYWGHQEQFFPYFREKGLTIVYDSADHSGSVSELLPYIDILFMSCKDEYPALRMHEYQKQGPHIVIAMMGEKGSLALADNVFYRCEAFPCAEVIDSLGAGDCYIGSFLQYYLKDQDVQLAMNFAAKKAADCLAYHGGFPQEGF